MTSADKDTADEPLDFDRDPGAASGELVQLSPLVRRLIAGCGCGSSPIVPTRNLRPSVALYPHLRTAQ